MREEEPDGRPEPGEAREGICIFQNDQSALLALERSTAYVDLGAKALPERLSRS